MFVCNSLIIYNIKFHSPRRIKTKSKSTNKRKTRTSFMLVMVTFSFMFLTLPSVIVHTFFRQFLLNKPYRRLVNMIVNNLLHTSHAIDFFLYVFTAPNFRAELYIFFSAIYAKITNKSTRDLDIINLKRFSTRNKTNKQTLVIQKSNLKENVNPDNGINYDIKNANIPKVDKNGQTINERLLEENENHKKEINTFEIIKEPL
jgi:hypothetical protein